MVEVVGADMLGAITGFLPTAFEGGGAATRTGVLTEGFFAAGECTGAAAVRLAGALTEGFLAAGECTGADTTGAAGAVFFAAGGATTRAG